MAVLDMKRIAVLGFQKHREPTMALLQRAGCVQIDPIGAEADGIPDVAQEELAAQQRMDRIARGLAALQLAAPVKASMFAIKPQIDIAEIETAEGDDAAWEAIDRLLAGETRLNEITAQQARCRALMTRFEAWEPLEAAMDSIADTQHTRIAPGLMPPAAMAQLDSLAEEFPLTSATEINRTREGVAVVFAAHASQAAEYFDRLRAMGWARLNWFSGDEGEALRGRTPAQALAGWQAALDDLEQKRAALLGEMAGDAQNRLAIQRLYDRALVLRDRAAAAARLAATRETFYLSGWCVADRSDDIRRRLEGELPGLAVFLSDPAPGEDVPTALRNSKAVEPFESVTNMFSAPDPKELDPNSIMAPFFAIFFGMMVSDAGYGIVTCIGAFLFLRFFKPAGMLKAIGQILIFGGVSTVFWGAMFGGWFSIEGIPPIMLSPMGNPLGMLGLCYGLGLIHIFVGLGMKLRRNIKGRDYMAALVDSGAWYMLIIGLIVMLGGGMVAGLPGFVSTVGTALTLLGFLLILFFTNRSTKNPLKRMVSGFGALYGITSYLSDVLSYSRLFAMGLATGVIGQVFNTLAGLMMGNPIGFVFGIAILAVGHTFNLAINTLGAYVHACRLQYIEFYNKFYDGGGKEFKPFSLRGKFINWQSKP